MKPLSVVFILVLFLGGCAQICSQFEAQPHKVPVTSDQLAFEQAFATFQESSQLKVLEDFIAIYPDSVWAQRAYTVVLYAREVEQRKELMRGQESTISEQVDKIRQLRQENARLAETIEQLKGSLIEIEKRPL